MEAAVRDTEAGEVVVVVVDITEALEATEDQRREDAVRHRGGEREMLPLNHNRDRPRPRMSSD